MLRTIELPEEDRKIFVTLEEAKISNIGYKKTQTIKGKNL